MRDEGYRKTGAHFRKEPGMAGRITRNAVKCLNCNEIIESVHRHHFVSCPCGSIAVDGGCEYLRRVGDGKYEDLSE